VFIFVNIVFCIILGTSKNTKPILIR